MDGRRVVVLYVLAAIFMVGCGGSDVPGPDPTEPTAVERSAGQSEWLPTPYTAEQIRNEWVEGFELVMSRSGPDGQRLERWRVVDWDPDGVTLENVVLDGDGLPASDPTEQRTSWSELRDHALFPSERTSRHRETRQTALGTLEGWVYTVADPERGTTSRFFFADSLPGAPVELDVLDGDTVVMGLKQLERSRPEPSHGTQG